MANVVHNQLSIAKIRALKEAGRYVDGGGLYRKGRRMGSNSHKKKHRPALPWKEVPAFFTGLDDLPMGDVSRVAFANLTWPLRCRMRIQRNRSPD
ncbi:MAG: hypothetical protein AAGA22_08365 [Pseudomonadota bacterium]